MAINTPKERDFYDPRTPFFRNALMSVLTIVLTSVCFKGNTAEISKAKEYPKDNSGIIEPPKKCKSTGALTLDKKNIHLEMGCFQRKGNEVKISIGKDIIIKPDEKGHYNIPNSNNAYFFIVGGKPVISFIRNGKRVSGMMAEVEDGVYLFEPYMPFIFPEK